MYANLCKNPLAPHQGSMLTSTYIVLVCLMGSKYSHRMYCGVSSVDREKATTKLYTMTSPVWFGRGPRCEQKSLKSQKSH